MQAHTDPTSSQLRDHIKYCLKIKSKFQVGLKSLLRQGLSEPDFYGDLVYKLKKIFGSNNFQRSSLK